MNTAFADTFYFLALLNSKDAAHPKAVAFCPGFSAVFAFPMAQNSAEAMLRERDDQETLADQFPQSTCSKRIRSSQSPSRRNPHLTT